MFTVLKKRWYVILLVLLAAGVIYWKYNAVQTAASKQSKYTVKRINVEDTLSLSGTVVASEDATLRFQTSGRLSWVGVKEGDYVKKYQTLASLDQRDVKNKLQQYLNTYMKNRWDYDQTKEDKDIKNIGGLSEDARREALRILDKAQFDLNNSVLDVELQQLAVEYSSLSTPIKGIVVRVDTPYAGVNITPAGSEFEVINPDTVYFSATADQTDVVNLRKGMKGEIVLDAYPDKSLQGMIANISFTPKTGESGTVYEAKLTMDVNNAAFAYRYGMTGDVSFVTQVSKNVLAIPTTLIKSENNKSYVMKIQNGNQIKTYIKTGEEFDNNTIITSGLKLGDVILE